MEFKIYVLCKSLFTFVLIVLFAFSAPVVCLAVPCLESRCVGGGEVAAAEAVAWVEATRSLGWVGKEAESAQTWRYAFSRMSKVRSYIVKGTHRRATPRYYSNRRQ